MAAIKEAMTPEDFDARAKRRTATAYLVAGLIWQILLATALLLARGGESLDLLANLQSLMLPFQVLLFAAGVIQAVLALHYSMRFVWAEGQWRIWDHWEDHEDFILATLLTAVCAFGIFLFLAPH